MTDLKLKDSYIKSAQLNKLNGLNNFRRGTLAQQLRENEAKRRIDS